MFQCFAWRISRSIFLSCISMLFQCKYWEVKSEVEIQMPVGVASAMMVNNPIATGCTWYWPLNRWRWSWGSWEGMLWKAWTGCWRRGEASTRSSWMDLSLRLWWSKLLGCPLFCTSLRPFDEAQALRQKLMFMKRKFGHNDGYSWALQASRGSVIEARTCCAGRGQSLWMNCTAW